MNNPQQITWYQNWPNATTTGYSYAVNTAPAAPAPAPEPEPRPRLGRLLDALETRLRKPAPDLPAIAGASPEAETSMRVEHKKKIILKRDVGVSRDKGSGPQEVHNGTLELVRTMEGDENQKRTIGFKVDSKSGSYVEIPVEDVRKALDELDPPTPSTP